MLIVADENIPFVREAFGALGTIRLISGRAMTPEAVRDAEMLLVRSVTPVNEVLLAGSAVRFVGTATIGADHVDQDYLARRDIRFAAAPGSNANSVAEYVTAALLVLARRQGRELAGRSLGVIGVGNVGSCVVEKARVLGMQVVLNDPLLRRKTGDARYRPLEEIFNCDFITLHVPLEELGPDPTWHLADAAFVKRMKPETVLLNTSRGAVADNAALLHALKTGIIAGAVLDVWEGEPVIDCALLDRVALGTPHIAGYSFDGKVNGTVMLYEAACDFLGIEPSWDAAAHMPAPEHPELSVDSKAAPGEDVLRQAVLTVYPIERDDRALRGICRQPPDERAAHFDRLRKEYPPRREFHYTDVIMENEDRRVAAALGGLGFPVRQRTEDGRRRTEDRRRTTEDGGRKAEDGGRTTGGTG